MFVQVCHAIQHAHQKGIIHSDIKPSNILVAEHDGISVPKVIDFGIAKATETPLGDRQGRTSLDRLAGTPAYMSPEQIELGGRDVDTRSDIYSLGALLYDLLAGRPPFDAEELMRAGLPEMRRTLMEQQPPPPSVAAMVDPARAKISQACRGDLDAIVAKATNGPADIPIPVLTAPEASSGSHTLVWTPVTGATLAKAPKKGAMAATTMYAPLAMMKAYSHRWRRR